VADSSTENVTKLSFASERMQAAERSQLRGFCLQTTSSVVEVLRCRSPFRYLPSSPIRLALTQMRCRTVAVHRRWYQSLCAPTTLAVKSPTDLFVAAHWLERSSLSIPRLFARIQSSRSQYFTSSNHLLCGFYLNFLLKVASKSLHVHQTSADWFHGCDVTRRG